MAHKSTLFCLCAALLALCPSETLAQRYISDGHSRTKYLAMSYPRYDKLAVNVQRKSIFGSNARPGLPARHIAVAMLFGNCSDFRSMLNAYVPRAKGTWNLVPFRKRTDLGEQHSISDTLLQESMLLFKGKNFRVPDINTAYDYCDRNWKYRHFNEFPVFYILIDIEDSTDRNYYYDPILAGVSFSGKYLPSGKAAETIQALFEAGLSL